MTDAEIAEFREWACSAECMNLYQEHYNRHEPNCRGDEIRELCDEVERLRVELKSARESIERGDGVFRDTNRQLAEALAECERLRARLREEMGVES